jgi:hypothetical protein
MSDIDRQHFHERLGREYPGACRNVLVAALMLDWRFHGRMSLEDGAIMLVKALCQDHHRLSDSLVSLVEGNLALEEENRRLREQIPIVRRGELTSVPSEGFEVIGPMALPESPNPHSDLPHGNPALASAYIHGTDVLSADIDSALAAMGQRAGHVGETPARETTRGCRIAGCTAPVERGIYCSEHMQAAHEYAISRMTSEQQASFFGEKPADEPPTVEQSAPAPADPEKWTPGRKWL